MSKIPEYEIIFTEQEIAARINIMAQEISCINNSRVQVVALMKGSFMFAADMARALAKVGVVCDIDFLNVSSYKGGTSSSQNIEISGSLDCVIAGQTILILDDIFDSGLTLNYVKSYLIEQGAKEIITCVLLRKQVAHATHEVVNFVGFECPNRFVFGYGMDYQYRFRQLPMIVALRDTK